MKTVADIATCVAWLGIGVALTLTWQYGGVRTDLKRTDINTGLAWIDGKTTCICQGAIVAACPGNLVIAPGVGSRDFYTPPHGAHDNMPLGPALP